MFIAHNEAVEASIKATIDTSQSEDLYGRHRFHTGSKNPVTPAVIWLLSPVWICKIIKSIPVVTGIYRLHSVSCHMNATLANVLPFTALQALSFRISFIMTFQNTSSGCSCIWSAACSWWPNTRLTYHSNPLCNMNVSIWDTSWAPVSTTLRPNITPWRAKFEWRLKSLQCCWWQSTQHI